MMDKLSFDQLPEAVARLLEKVERIERLLAGADSDTGPGLALKEMLTVEEASAYLGLSKSYLYKMSHRRELPVYRPGGKRLYFKRSDILAWQSSVRESSAAEIEQEATDYVLKHRRKW